MIEMWLSRAGHGRAATRSKLNSPMIGRPTKFVSRNVVIESVGMPDFTGKLTPSMLDDVLATAKAVALS